MMPVGTEPRGTIVAPVPHLAQADAQTNDWILLVSTSIGSTLDLDENQQMVNSRLSKCSPLQNNPVVKDLIKGSIRNGATGTCTSELHVLAQKCTMTGW